MPTKPIERKSKFVEGLETTAKVVGGGLAKGTVRIARQLGNQMERGITAPMTNPELTVRQNIINFADRMSERSAEAARTADAGEATRVGAITKATVNTLKDLASQFIYEDNPLLSASMGVPSLVAANPIVQFTKGMMSTGETESDRLLKPIEEKIAKWADVSDKKFYGQGSRVFV